MSRKPHPRHAAIAEQLGVSPATLKALLSIKAGRSAMNRGAYLQEKGLVRPAVGFVGYGWELTEAGAELLARARSLGF